MAAVFSLIGVLPLLVSIVVLSLALNRPETLMVAGAGVLLFEFIPLSVTGVIVAFTSMRTTSQRRWTLQSGLVGGATSMGFAIISGALAAFFGSDFLSLLLIGVLSGAGAVCSAVVVGPRRPQPAPDINAVF
ncbi:hypothetical protein [Brevundimonas lenta]|uniref:Pheromone shutdown protein TraB n=1 Tax=Brevundimonas lenta TaxID=424796 RepID=A0A7W6JCC1_9CAUL|nr:hypothetical protein [Brevundimonas lenta]MBB4081568.1 pheromone shutdown protein TraB [Brevundimonas lenta]